MTETQMRDKIAQASSLLHEVSNAVATNYEKDGLDPTYLHGKLQGDVINTAKHVQGQLTQRAKDIKREASRKK